MSEKTRKVTIYRSAYPALQMGLSAGPQALVYTGVINTPVVNKEENTVTLLYKGGNYQIIFLNSIESIKVEFED